MPKRGMKPPVPGEKPPINKPPVAEKPPVGKPPVSGGKPPFPPEKAPVEEPVEEKPPVEEVPPEEGAFDPSNALAEIADRHGIPVETVSAIAEDIFDLIAKQLELGGGQ